jgi:hypothetical protein
MGDPMDYYDVQAMVDKGDNAERAARQRHIEDVARDLRAEFRREVMELREEVGATAAPSRRHSTHAPSTWHERRPLNRARNRRGTARA